jgi:acetamidase/formamidase
MAKTELSLIVERRGSMARHTLEPERQTLHGQFSRDLAPALTIASGDTVCYRTLDAGWNLEPPKLDRTPCQKFSPRGGERDDGHALCGPVAIAGAQPGMVLEVAIDVVEPGDWGWTHAGGWPSELNKQLGVADGPEHLLRWQLDHQSGRAVNQHGHAVALRPFLGVIGMPPDEPGWHPSWPPRLCGGNIDCKELVAGSTLYLPIHVAGALLSVGDGHGAQGDGEVCSQGIECPMERVELTLTLRDDLRFTTPRANTPAGWLTLGVHEDLHQAMVMALNAMLDLMMERYGLDRPDALGLASLVVDMRITQVVNGVLGVHALLPHGALQR